MPKLPQHSLQQEYALYVENEIENYKDSVSRNVLLKIGDEAVASLREQQQLALTELVVWEEVDRIIKKRLRIPAYSTWRRKRIKLLEEYRRPEHWGLHPDSILAREIKLPASSLVLVAGHDTDRAALYLAALGCEVYAIDQAGETVARVKSAAEAAGFTDRVHGHLIDLREWIPAAALHDTPLNAVVCTPSAFLGLSERERERVIELLQGVTVDGGVHLVNAEGDGNDPRFLEQLSAQYEGWKIMVERHGDAYTTFLARKGAA